MHSSAKELPEALARLYEELCIPADYAAQCGLPRYEEPSELSSIGCDIEFRERYLAASVAPQWHAMCAAAAAQAVCLQVVSAYRSIDYQADLFRDKLRRGQSIEDILWVNTAPGFSEHHSGRALDITTPGYEPLSETFEFSAAFAWLRTHAQAFGFSMTYPRDNPWGIDYEPWHWCARAD